MARAFLPWPGFDPALQSLHELEVLTGLSLVGFRFLRHLLVDDVGDRRLVDLLEEAE